MIRTLGTQAANTGTSAPHPGPGSGAARIPCGTVSVAIRSLASPMATPANFFMNEIHVFAGNQPLATGFQPPNLTGGYPPFSAGHPFAISSGTLIAGSTYFTGCHPCGVVPYLPTYLPTWELGGSKLMLHNATRLSGQAPYPCES